MLELVCVGTHEVTWEWVVPMTHYLPVQTHAEQPWESGWRPRRSKPKGSAEKHQHPFEPGLV